MRKPYGAREVEAYGYIGPQYKTLEEYISIKLDMLQNDFCLQLSDEDIWYMSNLKTEADVDRCAHRWLRDRL